MKKIFFALLAAVSLLLLPASSALAAFPDSCETTRAGLKCADDKCVCGTYPNLGCTANVGTCPAGSAGYSKCPAQCSVGVLPVSGGGTGESSAAAALAALGGVPTNGVGATGNWAISVTGNAATATNAGTIGGVDLTRIVYGSNQFKTSDAGGSVSPQIGSGFYESSTAVDGPVVVPGWTHYLITNHSGSAVGNGYQMIIAQPYWEDNLYARRVDADNKRSWRKILDSGNFTGYAPSLTGAGANGNWGINITGSAGSAGAVAWSGITGKPGTCPGGQFVTSIDGALTCGSPSGGLTLTTSGTGTDTRTLSLLEAGDSKVSFGSYNGSWRSAIQLQGNDDVTKRLLFLAPPEADWGYSIIRSANGGMKFDVGGTVSDLGTNAVTIESNGNVGIGTTTNPYRLNVYGPPGSYPASVASPDGYLLFGPANTGWSHFTTDRPRFYFNTGVTVDSGNIGSYEEDLSLQTSNVTRITILNSNGKVGIGTTEPDAAYAMTLNGAATNGFLIKQPGTYSFGLNVDGGSPAIKGTSSNPNTGIGVLGDANTGVLGSGYAVSPSTYSYGVRGTVSGVPGSYNIGVRGDSTQIGVLGYNSEAAGSYPTGFKVGVMGHGKVAVFGYSADAGGAGVYGLSTVGNGGNFLTDATTGSEMIGYSIYARGTRGSKFEPTAFNGDNYVVLASTTEAIKARGAVDLAGFSSESFNASYGTLSLGENTTSDGGRVTVSKRLVLNPRTLPGDPSGQEGMIYYSNSMGRFRCYTGSGWGDCSNTGIGGGGSSPNFAYWSGPTTVSNVDAMSYNPVTQAVGVGGMPNSTSKLHVTGGFFQADKSGSTAPSGFDCALDTDLGRLYIDRGSYRLYICMGQARGWDYVNLTQ